MWGGPCPTRRPPSSILLARLFGPDGRSRDPGFRRRCSRADAAERAELRSLPFDEADFRADAGLVDGAAAGGDGRFSPYERLWTRPALAITALEGMPLAEAANQLIAEATARVGVRLAPGQDAERMRALLMDFLATDPPSVSPSNSRARARRRLAPRTRRSGLRGRTAGAGPRLRTPGRSCIGCGGSIPFVGPFSRGARRRAGAAARSRGSDLQRARREREPPPRRLPVRAARGRASVRRASDHPAAR